MQASIKNNVVFCKMCEAHNYKCIDYKTITKDGKTHTQVIARCNKCGTEFYFFTKIGIESETHYVFDEEVAEVKEKIGMKEITMKQADKILEVLNDIEISCEDCALKEPCDVYNIHKKEKKNNKESICGILTDMAQKMEDEEIEKAIEEYVNGEEIINE